MCGQICPYVCAHVGPGSVRGSKAHITSGFAPIPLCFPEHVALTQSRDHLPLTGPCFVTKERSLERLVLQVRSVAVTNITTQTVEEETVYFPLSFQVTVCH